MTTIYYESDADLSVLDGQRIAVVGYGNQGRSWALNLRDSGLAVNVFARADASREQAVADGFQPAEIDAASACDVICTLIPDDVIPELPITPEPGALWVLASGYVAAFGRIDPDCDLGMVAPRMLGPEVRECYVEGVGFITALGVQKDNSGTALARTLAVGRAIGGLRQGAIEMTPRQEAVLDLAVEQVLAPALGRVSKSFVELMSRAGIPLEAIITELVLSGEVERSYRLLRLEGYAGQMRYHSPTSQYGQMSRADRYDGLDVPRVMREVLSDIESGRFADEWDAERAAGYPNLERLRAERLNPAVVSFEEDLRARLGERNHHFGTG
ncbi:NAD(P)-binding domain-containing protein [Mycobacterium sp. UM_CSW]|uniref:NAD(P)-binding domain-containing protein n=1 Tax=Mycobacterium sp. UM_CSW TaxID=1370119 RepID=UPI0003F68FD5|nr:NAD(P)-binding domain-containing protein [Mycobacterium sp. UM_CSW]